MKPHFLRPRSQYALNLRSALVFIFPGSCPVTQGNDLYPECFGMIRQPVTGFQDAPAGYPNKDPFQGHNAIAHLPADGTFGMTFLSDLSYLECDRIAYKPVEDVGFMDLNPPSGNIFSKCAVRKLFPRSCFCLFNTFTCKQANLAVP